MREIHHFETALQGAIEHNRKRTTGMFRGKKTKHAAQEIVSSLEGLQTFWNGLKGKQKIGFLRLNAMTVARIEDKKSWDTLSPEATRQCINLAQMAIQEGKIRE